MTGIKKQTSLDDNINLKQALDDPFLDGSDMEPSTAREAAKVLAGIAVEKGASPEDPCGLDEVLNVLFGEEIDLVRKPKEA